jgi:acylphosphatase
MGNELSRVHAYFTGRVQGVFFRASTMKRAVELGLKGWVRNLHDGRVEAVFEGPQKDINSILDWCEHSMPMAKVISVATNHEEPEGIEGFEILR